jgi:hypothetical protein
MQPSCISLFCFFGTIEVLNTSHSGNRSTYFVSYLNKNAVVRSFIAFSNNKGVPSEAVLRSFKPLIGISLKGLMCRSPSGMRSK